MGAAKGNQNAKGSKGGGRKSAYEELANAIEAQEMWRNQVNVEELRQKLQEKKTLSPKEAALLRMLSGSDRLLGNLMNKVLPDKVDVTSGGKLITAINIIQPASEEEDDADQDEGGGEDNNVQADSSAIPSVGEADGSSND